MNILNAILLGLVQGLTEFLPVSSSGHLVVAETLLGVAPPGLVVEVALHVATLFSVLLVYRRRFVELAIGAVRRDTGALAYIGLLALASIPAAIVGLGFEDFFERVFDTPPVTGFMLLVTGGLLWSTRYARRRECNGRIGWSCALFIGVAQACAIFPGISRSGATITAGLWKRIDAERAAEFSFLMSVPAIAGAALLQVGEIGASITAVDALPLAVAFLTSLVSGIAAIIGLLWFLRHQAFHAFAYYVWIVGALFLAFLWMRGGL